MAGNPGRVKDFFRGLLFGNNSGPTFLGWVLLVNPSCKGGADNYT